MRRQGPKQIPSPQSPFDTINMAVPIGIAFAAKLLNLGLGLTAFADQSPEAAAGTNNSRQVALQGLPFTRTQRLVA